MPLRRVREPCGNIQGRLVGSDFCNDCLFHNDSYKELPETIYCVFPEEHYCAECSSFLICKGSNLLDGEDFNPETTLYHRVCKEFNRRRAAQ